MNLLIASYLEPHLVDRIRGVDAGIDVVYEPTLLPTPRYPADHTGKPLVRSEAQSTTWRRHLSAADVLFDFDYTNAADLPELAPQVRWIQATSAGIGRFVARHRYAERMPNTVFTTASGIHAQPLAEFCLMAMLATSRRLVHTIREQSAKRWERFAGTDLRDRTLVVVGAGAIGREVARVVRPFGVITVGVKHTVSAADRRSLPFDELYPVAELDAVLPRAEFLVLCVPHTAATERMMDSSRLARLPERSVLINIARGAVVDETALLEALNGGTVGTAFLDVTATEPLPPDSPLWSHPHVLISPHSASTSDRENERITDLFVENLERFLAGQPLRNVFGRARGY